MTEMKWLKLALIGSAALANTSDAKEIAGESDELASLCEKFLSNRNLRGKDTKLAEVSNKNATTSAVGVLVSSGTMYICVSFVRA